MNHLMFPRETNEWMNECTKAHPLPISSQKSIGPDDKVPTGTTTTNTNPPFRIHTRSRIHQMEITRQIFERHNRSFMTISTRSAISAPDHVDAHDDVEGETPFLMAATRMRMFFGGGFGFLLVWSSCRCCGWGGLSLSLFVSGVFTGEERVEGAGCCGGETVNGIAHVVDRDARYLYYDWWADGWLVTSWIGWWWLKHGTGLSS